MTRKILGYEILEMKNKWVKSEKDSFYDKIIEQKIAFLCLIWGTCRILDNVNMCFGVCNVVWVILEMMSLIPSSICNWSLPR